MAGRSGRSPWLSEAIPDETVYVAHAVPGTGRTVVFSVGARF